MLLIALLLKVVLGMDRYLVRSNPTQQRRPTFTVNLSISECNDVRIGDKVDISYTYGYNRHLIPNPNTSSDKHYKGYPSNKGKCIAKIKKVYGDNSITVGSPALFNRNEEEKKKECNICNDYPSHFLKQATLKKIDDTIASFNGSRYKIRSLINHVTSLGHKLAIEQSRAKDLVHFHECNPDIEAKDATTKLILDHVITNKSETYQQRFRQTAIVRSDVKLVTVTANTFSARDSVDGYVQHMQDLKEDAFQQFVPSGDDCKYNHPAAHKRYR